MTRIKNIIDFIRVKQWYKNIIVFLPLVFSLGFFVQEKLGIIMVGFIALSLVSSATYVRNDIRDIEQDRSHPLKKLRALPSALLTVKQAWMLFIILIVTGFVIGTILSGAFVAMLVLLFVNTEIYSRYTKSIIFLDAFAIGINFIIRAVSGIVLLHVPMSPWIILGVFFVALFLAFIKRKAEFVTLEKAYEHRISLKDYSDFSLNTALGISAVMIIVTYSLYAMNGPNNDWRLILTVPFIVFIILRHIHLSSINDKIAQTNEIFKDKQTLFAMVAYAVLTMFLLYLGHSTLFSYDF